MSHSQQTSSIRKTYQKKNLNQEQEQFLDSITKLERGILTDRQRIQKARLAVKRLELNLVRSKHHSNKRDPGYSNDNVDHVWLSVGSITKQVKLHHKSLKRQSEKVERARSLVSHPIARAAYSKAFQVQSENESRVKRLRRKISTIRQQLELRREHPDVPKPKGFRHVTTTKKSAQTGTATSHNKEPRFLFNLNGYEAIVQKALTGRACDPEYVLRLTEDSALFENDDQLSESGFTSFIEEETPRNRKQIPRVPRTSPRANLPQIPKTSRTDRLATRSRIRQQKHVEELENKNKKAHDPSSIERPRKGRKKKKKERMENDMIKAFEIQQRMERVHDEFVTEWEQQLEWNLKHTKNIREPGKPSVPKPITHNQSALHRRTQSKNPALNQVGIIRVQVVEVSKLRDVQGVGQIKPFVRVTLTPSCDVSQTKHLDTDHARMIFEPVKHHSILDFAYRGKGHSGLSPTLRVEVIDQGVFKNDVPIGLAEISLFDAFDSPGHVIECNVKLSQHPAAPPVDGNMVQSGKVSISILFLDVMHSNLPNLPRHTINPEHIEATRVDSDIIGNSDSNGNRISRLALNKVGVVRVRIASAINLNIQNCIQPQLSICLLPWAEVQYDNQYLTSYINNSTSFPTAPRPTVHDLRYHGLPPTGTKPVLLIKVLDSHLQPNNKNGNTHDKSTSTQKKVIGSGLHDISCCLERPRIAQEVQVELRSEKGKPIGVFLLHIAFSSDGPLPTSQVFRHPPCPLFPKDYYPPSRVMDIATQEFWAQQQYNQSTSHILSNQTQPNMMMMPFQSTNQGNHNMIPLDPALARLEGTILVQPMYAKALKQVQWVGKQDPYVKVTLEPWGIHVATKEHNDGGKDPQWELVKHQSQLELPYKGSTLQNNLVPYLQVQVFDKETTKSDRLIGEAVLQLGQILARSGGNPSPVSLALVDKSSKPAGTLVVNVCFKQGEVSNMCASSGTNSATSLMIDSSVKDNEILHQNGTFRVQAIMATNLKNVQWVGKQDPFVKVFLSNKDKCTQTKDHNDGGKNPIWDPEKHNSVMLLPYNGKEEAKFNQDNPVLNIHVMDKEASKADRLIGEGKLPLSTFLYHPGEENDRVKVELCDSSGKPAGQVMLSVTFLLDLSTKAKTGTGGTVVNYDGSLELTRCEASNIRAQRASKALYLKLTMQPQGTVYCTQAIEDHTCRNRVWLSPSRLRQAGEKQCVIQLPKEAKKGEDALNTMLLAQLYQQRDQKDDKLVGEAELSFSRNEIDTYSGELMIDLILHEPRQSSTSPERRKSQIAAQAGILNLGFVLQDSKAARRDKTSGAEIKANESSSKNEAKEESWFRVLHVQPLHAEGLVSVQRIGEQDPYVVVILDPLGKSLRTLEHNNGGRAPEWDSTKHSSELLFKLNESDAKREDLQFRIQVMDAELVMADRLIGSGKTGSVAQILDEHGPTSKKKVTVPLYTKKGESSGNLTLLLWHTRPAGLDKRETKQQLTKEEAASRIQALRRGRVARRTVLETLVKLEPQFEYSVKLQPKRGLNLRNVHRIGKQDPYVTVTLEPLKFRRKTKAHKNGGRNPVWDPHQHASELLFQVDTLHKKRVTDLDLHFEVVDEESFRKDRFIARGKYALQHLAVDPTWQHEWDLFAEQSSTETAPSLVIYQKDQLVTLPLTGPSGEPAGSLEFTVSVEYPKEAVENELQRQKAARLETSSMDHGFAATRIQAIHRGMQGRNRALKYLERRNSLMNLDGQAMGALERALLRNEQEAGAATRIQRMYKSGYQARNQAAKTIQARLRGYKLRNSISNNRGKGKLYLTVLQAFDLKPVRKFGKQQTYLRATLLPWCESHQTKAQENESLNPIWDRKLHDAEIVFEYPNHPIGVVDYWKRPVPAEPWNVRESPKSRKKESQERDQKIPSLLLEVLDSQMTGQDKLIGRAVFSLLSPLQSCGEQVAHQIAIVDAKGKPAGIVVVNVRYAPEVALGASLQLKDQETLLMQLQDQQHRAFELIQEAERQEDAARVLQREVRSKIAQGQARTKIAHATELREKAALESSAIVALQARLRGLHARQEYERLRQNAERLRKLAHQEASASTKSKYSRLRVLTKPKQREIQARQDRAEHLRLCAEAEENSAIAVRNEIERLESVGESKSAYSSPVGRAARQYFKHPTSPQRASDSDVQQVDVWRFKINECADLVGFGGNKLFRKVDDSFATVVMTLHPERVVKQTTSSSRNGPNPKWNETDPRNIAEFVVPHMDCGVAGSYIEFQVFMSDSQSGNQLIGSTHFAIPRVKPMGGKVFTLVLELNNSSGKAVGQLTAQYQYDEQGVFGNLLLPDVQNLVEETTSSRPLNAQYQCYETRVPEGYVVTGQGQYNGLPSCDVSNMPQTTNLPSNMGAQYFEPHAAPMSPAAMMSGHAVSSIDIDEELKILKERRSGQSRQYWKSEDEAATTLQRILRGQQARHRAKNMNLVGSMYL